MLTDSRQRWFLFVNVAAFAAIVAAYLAGKLDGVISPASYEFAAVIGLVFLFGLLRSYVVFWRASRFNMHRGVRVFGRECIQASWTHQVGRIGMVASGLLMLGLIGTVVGFMHALSAETLQGALSGDTNAFKALIVQISGGTGIALQTTLLGSLGYLWLAMNRSAIKNIVTEKWIASLIPEGFGEVSGRTVAAVIRRGAF